MPWRTGKLVRALGTVAGASALLALAAPPALAGPASAGTSAARAVAPPPGMASRLAPGAVTTLPAAAAVPGSAPAGRLPSAGESPVTEVSKGCRGQNAEVEEAVARPRYVYEVWIGCNGIGFARSADGGLHFSAPVTVPGSAGFSWDPSIAVGPGGTVYAAFMHMGPGHNGGFPLVDASFNHGRSFPQVSRLIPPKQGNWGDRDFVAVGRNGDVYLTWDYGPSAQAVTLLCSVGGSCAFSAGDVNAVIQKSSNGGRTWGRIIPVGPLFPRNGGYSAPLVVQPDGRVDVLYWGHFVSKPPAYTLHPGHEFFTSSPDGTRWPRRPLELGPSAGQIALPVWWIDGDIAADGAGNLYATWDTQTSGQDIGWLSYSANAGRTWSAPVRVTQDRDRAVHIVEVAGGQAGIGYVAWQTDAPRAGYATYVRPFSVRRGWLAPAVRVSTRFGNAAIWPGDTFGIATFPWASGPHVIRLVLSWGSAVGRSTESEIYAAAVVLRV
jgi:hypothetical protein